MVLRAPVRPETIEHSDGGSVGKSLRDILLFSRLGENLTTGYDSLALLSTERNGEIQPLTGLGRIRFP